MRFQRIAVDLTDFIFRSVKCPFFFFLEKKFKMIQLLTWTKFGTKRVFFFTNNDKPWCKDENATIAKANDMSDAGIEMNLLALSEEDFDMSLFYDKICSMDVDELTSANDVKKQMTTFADLENGLRVKEVKKRSLLSCPFTIGRDHNIAVQIYCTRRPAKKDSPVWLNAGTNQPLVTETKWLCKDTGTILDEFSIQNYFEYGPSKTRIYFTKQEVEELKTFGSPCF
ncbi:hypothetical protein RFI_15086, partial [Reticulomyxa filosa]